MASEHVKVAVDGDDMVLWKEAATRVRLAQATLDQLGDPAPGSGLAQDDMRCNGPYISDSVRGHLDAALDNLTLWANVVAPRVFIKDVPVENPPRPYFTLARAGLESAAQAVWLLSPQEQDERIARHLRLAVNDLEEMRRTARLVDSSAEEAVKERIVAVRDTAGGPIKVAPNYLDMVRAAANLGGLEPDDAEALWRTASAAAHGKLWFLEATYSTDLGEEFSAGRFRAVRRPDAGTISTVVTLATEVTERAVVRYALMLGAPLERITQRAVEQLRKNLPRTVTPAPE
ncbi:hypothetical protein GCM10009718_36880 [Isoptericola halotolerans]|uniref:Uncharacterized protein n=1 Tax=Isoptericola halotolerans TaxID=300560 RepID=A0ABX2A7W4_9MICO|nr:hypothetical protein [Isoptericola halotolerans]NOV98751.1 hypothetical protein [Isoptericola halotolerans]